MPCGTFLRDELFRDVKPRSHPRTDRNWSLIKPHGSINWFHEVNKPYIPAAPPADLAWNRQTFQCVSPETALDLTRHRANETHRRETQRYPALAMPEGPDDTLVLPTAHGAFFWDSLHSAREIDILVIGYSGLDHQILKTVKSTGCQVRRMTIVNQNQATAADVLERFKNAGLDPVWPNVIDGDFASWSNDGGLNKLIEEYDGPYT